ncbi:MAG: hypothetical protein FWD61_13225 [Phycisphaerales bacterium]|nr:hypothetical protein [Phycisphaerales bacterium]
MSFGRNNSLQVLEPIPDGRSIFATLAQMADLVVVEDVDLDSDQLCSHLREHNLTELAASDATDHVRMQSANLFCITNRQHGGQLSGKRLW